VEYNTRCYVHDWHEKAESNKACERSFTHLGPKITLLVFSQQATSLDHAIMCTAMFKHA